MPLYTAWAFETTQGVNWSYDLGVSQFSMHRDVVSCAGLWWLSNSRLSFRVQWCRWLRMKFGAQGLLPRFLHRII